MVKPKKEIASFSICTARPMHPIVNGLPELLSRIESRKGAHFGPRRNPITGLEELHDGIDLPCGTGTKIRAPWDGEVDECFESPKGGLSLIIYHEEEHLKSGYAHLRATIGSVDKGDLVRRGEPIAVSGSTGKSTGPHLHFTIRRETAIEKDWVKVDPLPFLESAGPDRK